MNRAEMLEATNTVLSSYERTCADCKKSFIVQCAELWTYKIARHGTCIDYFCCYTCWMKTQRKKEQQTKQKLTNQEAYFERLRQKKNKENRKRRDRANELT